MALGLLPEAMLALSQEVVLVQVTAKDAVLSEEAERALHRQKAAHQAIPESRKLADFGLGKGGAVMLELHEVVGAAGGQEVPQVANHAAMKAAAKTNPFPNAKAPAV